MNAPVRIDATAPTIEITVNPAGESTVRTTGFAGPSCRDASRFIEQALGQGAAERLTSDFYLSQATPERAREGA